MKVIQIDTGKFDIAFKNFLTAAEKITKEKTSLTAEEKKEIREFIASRITHPLIFKVLESKKNFNHFLGKVFCRTVNGYWTSMTPDSVVKAARIYIEWCKKDHKKPNWNSFMSYFVAASYTTFSWEVRIEGENLKVINKPEPIKNISAPKSIYDVDFVKVKSCIESWKIHTWTEDKIWTTLKSEDFFTNQAYRAELKKAFKWARKNRWFKTWKDWLNTIVASNSWHMVYSMVGVNNANTPNEENFARVKNNLKNAEINQDNFYRFVHDERITCHGFLYCDYPLREAARYEARINKFPTWVEWATKVSNSDSWKEVYSDFKELIIPGMDFKTVKSWIKEHPLGLTLKDAYCGFKIPCDIINSMEFNRNGNIAKHGYHQDDDFTWWHEAVINSKNWNEVYPNIKP